MLSEEDIQHKDSFISRYIWTLYFTLGMTSYATPEQVHDVECHRSRGHQAQANTASVLPRSLVHAGKHIHALYHDHSRAEVLRATNAHICTAGNYRRPLLGDRSDDIGELQSNRAHASNVCLGLLDPTWEALEYMCTLALTEE